MDEKIVGKELAYVALREAGFEVTLGGATFCQEIIVPVGIFSVDEFLITRISPPEVIKVIRDTLTACINYPVSYDKNNVWEKLENVLKSVGRKVKLVPRSDPYKVGRYRIQILTSEHEWLPLGEIAVNSKVMIIALPLKEEVDVFSQTRLALSKIGFRSAW